MKKSTYIILALAVIFAVAAIAGFSLLGRENNWICVNGEWVKHGNPSSPMPETGCGVPKSQKETREIKGVVTGIIGNILKIRTDAGEAEITLGSGTSITDIDGNKVDMVYVRKGFTVKAIETISDGKSDTTEVNITKEPNILVYEPVTGQEISGPFNIIGEARVFESTFNYRITDGKGNILSEGLGYSNAPDAGLYGQFDIPVAYPKSDTEDGFVEVFDYSAKDGAEIDKVIVPIKIKKSAETMKIKVYFGSQKLNPEAMDCSKVYPRERVIPKTVQVAKAALEELLAGPDTLETKDGYYSSINPGVKVQKITIEKGVAKADFDKTLDQSVGGSCRVISIRSQITETLKQFPTVKQVIISIDGRTEDILQP